MKYVAAVGMFLCLSLMAVTAAAAEPTKVATVNPAKIFNDMQELKDLRSKMDSEAKLLKGVDQEKVEKLKALQEARNALKVDTAQYQDKNAEVLKASIEYETWVKLSQANFQREQKQQLKLLYQKIEQAVSEVAKQKGLDLVIADQRADLPDDLDKVNIDQLRGLINSRTVLYSGDKMDISADVLALLDTKYRTATTKP